MAVKKEKIGGSGILFIVLFAVAVILAVIALSFSMGRAIGRDEVLPEVLATMQESVDLNTYFIDYIGRLAADLNFIAGIDDPQTVMGVTDMEGDTFIRAIGILSVKLGTQMPRALITLTEEKQETCE